MGAVGGRLDDRGSSVSAGLGAVSDVALDEPVRGRLEPAESRPVRWAPRYLFLQGMATPFLWLVGAELVRRGHVVRHINFNAGDRLYWRLPGAADYRGDIAGWPGFLETQLDAWGITDIVLFGDCRPIHVAAIRVASLRGIPVHVFEEGYLRPSWITLEAGGVNGKSSLPRDPAWFLSEASLLPPWDGGKSFPSLFWLRAAEDVAYHVTSYGLAWLYPGYRSHLIVHPFREYAGWLWRFACAPLTRRRNDAALRALEASRKPYFVVPLQIDTDTQIRFHSVYGGLAPAIGAILESFARHAPADTLLVIKEHPLDPGVVNWRRIAAAKADELEIGARVIYLAGGSLDRLAAGSRGLVTVNSTSAVTSLALSVPTIALAPAIYDMPGLTFQGGIDRFWSEASAPDPVLFDAFRRVVAERTQVNGGFFSKEGMALAVAGAADRLERTSGLPSDGTARH